MIPVDDALPMTTDETAGLRDYIGGGWAKVWRGDKLWCGTWSKQGSVVYNLYVTCCGHTREEVRTQLLTLIKIKLL